MNVEVGLEKAERAYTDAGGGGGGGGRANVGVGL